MKQLSSIELRFLLRELELLVDKRIDKVYQLSGNEFLFQFGRANLRIILPSLAFIAPEKPQAPEKPSDFCMVLRKYIQNSRLRKIEQLGSERILVLEFEKDEKVTLIVELFSKGNLVLVKENKIVSALLCHKWSQRTIRGGIDYTPPPAKVNLFEIKEDELKRIIQSSTKESIVKTLATDLGLGGLFAEELCSRSGIDKEKKTADSSSLYKELKKLLSEKISPAIVLENNLIKDAVPVQINNYANYKKTKTFSEALSLIYAQDSVAEKTKSGDAAFQKELKKLEAILDSQKKSINEISSEIKEYESKAKYIYEHYGEFQQVLLLLKDLKRKKQLKGLKNKLIKAIDEKEGTFVVEL
ncbi:NFACT family protein [Candidatus Woesearchaeota archaeon]|nr:NFACT family protein [Candidatus Woesearchaeota archaeon]